jgi:hypothetical protein
MATETKSKTEALMEAVRAMPLFRQLVPMEAGIGWPIPLRKEGNVYATLPCYGMAPSAEAKMTVLHPPFAAITLAWSNHVPVEYVNLRFRNPWPEGRWGESAGSFPHAAVAGLRVAEYTAKRRELLRLYDELFHKLGGGEPFPPQWCDEFSRSLRLLMEPPLEPYYRALGPKFFERFLPASES